jgi:hypothetical protein
MEEVPDKAMLYIIHQLANCITVSQHTNHDVLSHTTSYQISRGNAKLRSSPYSFFLKRIEVETLLDLFDHPGHTSYCTERY